MSKQNEIIADTLALVNVARTAYGYDPLTDLPTARQGDAHDCLYYRALKDVGVESVSGGGEMTFASPRVAATVAELWGVEANGSNVQAPVQFGNVINKFDRGAFPHYSDKTNE